MWVIEYVIATPVEGRLAMTRSDTGDGSPYHLLDRDIRNDIRSLVVGIWCLIKIQKQRCGEKWM